MKRPGLRARVTAGFAIGALMVSAVVALLSYQFTEGFLLQERERSAVRATYLEAGIVRAGLATDHPDIAAVLRTLDTGGKRRAVLFREGTWYGRNADFGIKSTIPQDLQAMINSGVPGAQRRFQQILANLINNAQHHGGGVTAIGVGQRGKSWLLDIDDEGPGVNPPDRDIIFDRFVRGRVASARGDSDGAGLGLAIVHQHVLAHDGTVTVTDRPGGGARFRIVLPRTSR
jgi:signal transduction histidine kinase